MKIRQSNLQKWLCDPRALEYFGPTFQLRAGVLAAVLSGGNVAEAGRKFGRSKQAAQKQASRARRIFGQPPVD